MGAGKGVRQNGDRGQGRELGSMGAGKGVRQHGGRGQGRELGSMGAGGREGS